MTEKKTAPRRYGEANKESKAKTEEKELAKCIYIYIFKPQQEGVERTSSYCLTVYQKAFQAGLSFKGTSSTPIPGTE